MKNIIYHTLFVLVLLPLVICGCKEKQKKYDDHDFRIAMRNGDIETMRVCIERGNTRDINIELKSVSEFRDISDEAYKYLLDIGADPNFKSYWEDGESGFLVAKVWSFALVDTYNNPGRTKMLIDYGADVNMNVEANANLLMYYIQIFYKQSKNGDPAGIKGDILNSIRVLMEHGANTSFRGETGLTPMLLALNYDTREVVELLLEFGVELSAEPVRVDFNYDPLGLREWDENYGIVWQTDFLIMANCGYVDILMPYIENGVITPDHATPDGYDIYYHAAQGGNPELMMQLLPYLKDINSKKYSLTRYSGANLLHVAAINGNGETAKVLLANGIDPDSKVFDRGGFEYSAYYLADRKYDRVTRESVRRIISNFNSSILSERRDYSEYKINK